MAATTSTGVPRIAFGPPTPYRPGPRFPSLTSPAQDLAARSKAHLDQALTGMPRLATVDWLPPLTVVEDPDGFTVTAEVAGIDSADIDLNLSDGVLTLRGTRREPLRDGPQHWYRAEVPTGSFERAVPIGRGIDEDRVQAMLNDGVLTIRLFKREDRKRNRRTVPISG